ncbi:MAG: DNA-processing protein DprA [Betaproteobacteria bacterium]
MTPTESSALDWATLAHKALPQRALVALLRAFGSPAAILEATPAQLALHATRDVADAIRRPVDSAALATTRRWMDDPANHVVAWGDADYPKTLLDLGHAPAVLFYRGDRTLLNRPSFAIVGSRHATPQGVSNAREFATALGAAGLTIVSGLALGIDAAAHEGGLATPASTLAVIGTGPDRVYPARNRDLARRIADAGGILSEFVPGTPPRKDHFPRRNRLISGLARGVLVVEATLSSGSLITARWAGEQGREVFAIPGSIHSPFARGCHKLIREGAKLVETAADVLEELGVPTGTAAGPSAAAPGPRSPAADATGLLSMLGHDPATVDALAERTGEPAHVVMAALVRLELDGLVSALPGGSWQRT